MKTRAFTLIELLVVISIIALLASVVLASLNSARDKGRLGGANYFAAQVDHMASDSAAGIWDFDECSGTSAADRSGNGANLGFYGGASFSTDTPLGKGCSLLLDGINGYAMTSNLGIASSTSFTASFWLRADPQAANYRRIMSGPAATSIYFTSNGTTGIYGTVGNSASGWLMLSNDITGRWNHIVLTLDSSDGKAKAYLNGAFFSAWNLGFGAVTIGSFYVGSESGTSYYLAGKIDNLRVFTKTLTAQEAGELYASEKSLFMATK